MARVVAKAIDFLIVLSLVFIFSTIGVFFGMFYLCITDALFEGRSIGKKIMGFAVISLIDGKPCSVKQSCIRNLPFIVPLFFAIIPLWGWIFAGLIGIPLTALELYLLFTLDSGHRLGDDMADTTVIANDAKRQDLQRRREAWFEGQNPLHLR